MLQGDLRLKNWIKNDSIKTSKTWYKDQNFLITRAQNLEMKI